MSELPPGFGYVAGVVALSTIVHNGWMSGQVMEARTKYRVKYPTLYADATTTPDETARTAFNCVQR